MAQPTLPASKLGNTSLTVSRIGLGTAEIGFAYGLGKKTLPSQIEAVRFLKTAADMGVTYFDTANLYGLSEERIRQAGLPSLPGVVIGTKCGQFLEKIGKLPVEEMEKNIRNEVESSLQKLGMDILPLLYLHGGGEADIREGKICEIMLKMKEEEKTRHLGISVRGEAAALAAVESRAFEVVQIAFNILDQRMLSRLFQAAAERGIGLVNRSVLLKGVLTKNYSLLPAVLTHLQQGAQRAEKIAQSLGLDLPALAVRFVISFNNISTSLIGTNNAEHLKSALNAMAQGPLPSEILEELKKLAITDPDQVDPACWPAIP